MKKAKQLNLFNHQNFSESALAGLGLTKTGARMTELGGDVRKNKRKVTRPFDSSKAHHIAMRSVKAKDTLSMLTKENKILVSKIIRTESQKYSIQVIELANVEITCI